MDEDRFKEAQKALSELSVPKQHEMLPVVDDMVEKLVQEASEPVREPPDSNRYKEPFQYYESAEGTGGLPAVICTCGWSKHHLRFKVLGRASEKHWLKTGHNTKKEKS